MYKIKKFHSNHIYYKSRECLENESKTFISEFKSNRDFESLFNFFEVSRKSKYILDKTRLNECLFKSANGADLDAIEGVSRYLPYLSVNILNMKDSDEKEQHILEFVNILSQGTNKNSASYWGDPLDYDQLVCEASDIALSLWLLKDLVWDKLECKHQVLSWLFECQKKKVSENNWFLFIITIQAVLNSFDSKYDINTMLLDKVLSWEVQDGWFRDGKKGDIDLYSCWAINYSIFWLSLINPTLIGDKRDFFKRSYDSVLELYDSKGRAPIFGRSVCYRLSISVPLFSYAYLSQDESIGQTALSILSKSYEYYSQKGAFVSGRVSSGVFSDDLTYLDDYSGPHSSLWGLRSLIIAEYGRYVGLWNIDCIELNAEFYSSVGVQKEHFLKERSLSNKDNVIIRNPNMDKKRSKITIRTKVRSLVLQILKLRKERRCLHRDSLERTFNSNNKFYT